MTTYLDLFILPSFLFLILEFLEWIFGLSARLLSFSTPKFLIIKTYINNFFFLAQSFSRVQGFLFSCLKNIYINPILEFLEWIFSQERGVCLLPPGGVLKYIENVQTGRNNNVIAAKRPLKNRKENECTKLVNL